MCILMAAREYYISPFVPKSFLGFETKFCPEWSIDKDLTSNLGSLSSVLQPCAMQSSSHGPPRTCDRQHWLSHLALKSIPEHQIGSLLFSLQIPAMDSDCKGQWGWDSSYLGNTSTGREDEWKELEWQCGSQVNGFCLSPACMLALCHSTCTAPSLPQLWGS